MAWLVVGVVGRTDGGKDVIQGPQDAGQRVWIRTSETVD
jgi:hypothetical protein